jgi:poly-beta-hydroxyalkanoate depolymerase
MSFFLPRFVQNRHVYDGFEGLEAGFAPLNASKHIDSVTKHFCSVTPSS